jgi:hypothetical protein
MPESASYQHRWGGLSVRKGDDLVDAPAADQELAKTYPQWPDKGGVEDGVALTLMTAKTTYAVDEEVRVIHVLDVSVPGRGVYVMGPKVPNDEYIDGVRATAAPEIAAYPWVGTYDGVVLPSPAVDFNYDITSYRFKAGKHTIEWRMGGLRSNAIAIDVR